MSNIICKKVELNTNTNSNSNQ